MRRTIAIAGGVTLALLIGCAGSPLGESVQQALEPDPQLEESPAFGIDPDASTEDASTAINGDQDTNDSASTPVDADADTDSTAAVPQPGDPDFIGPVRPATDASISDAGGSPPLATVPEELRSYLRDLLALDLLTLDAEGGESARDRDLDWNAPITRRDYARWLFQVHNAFYAQDAGKRIRSGDTADTPAFQDVPATDPDFGAIQGLAEAGIIPSALSGNSTAVSFRPDAPLTRETLVLWKVPLDTRRALPQVDSATVTATWGFQDVTQIEPLALRAIAADYQLGDFANIRRAFGYTTLLQPQKAVTRAEAAAALWRFGTQTEGRTAKEVQQNPVPDSEASRSRPTRTEQNTVAIALGDHHRSQKI